jgi:hypothetical protein
MKVYYAKCRVIREMKDPKNITMNNSKPVAQ